MRPPAADSPSTPVLEAVELTHRYADGTLAVDALTLEVRAGEIYCLLGANGAGKTTTLKLFLGFLTPTAGETRIAGVPVYRQPAEALAHAAFVSDDTRLYGEFTARWNVRFFARLSGRRDLAPQELDRTLRRVGLPERAFDQTVRTLSRGQRQKLGLAVAMIKGAPALLLDEPLSGLDPRAALEMVEILQELRQAGKAILLSTHDVFRARELGDRVGILKEGRKVLERDRAQLEEESLDRLYLNFLYSGKGFQPAPGGSVRP